MPRCNGTGPRNQGQGSRRGQGGNKSGKGIRKPEISTGPKSECDKDRGQFKDKGFRKGRNQGDVQETKSVKHKRR